jgi:uncharacterized protein YegL
MSDSNEKVLDVLLKDQIKDKLNDAGITSNGTDEIVCIVDRSGSMRSMQDEAQGGLNAFIEEQKKVGKANLTIVEFDNTVDVVCDQVNINEAKEYILNPRGMTSLLDAIGIVISEKDKYTSTDGKTIVVVLTDGDENSSKEWRADKINALINERKEDGWEFMFLAAGQNAIEVGQAYGFDKDSTVTFANNSNGMNHATNIASGYTSTLRSFGKKSALGMKSAYVSANLDALSEVGNIGDPIVDSAVPDIGNIKK